MSKESEIFTFTKTNKRSVSKEFVEELESSGASPELVKELNKSWDTEARELLESSTLFKGKKMVRLLKEALHDKEVQEAKYRDLERRYAFVLKKAQEEILSSRRSEKS